MPLLIYHLVKQKNSHKFQTKMDRNNLKSWAKTHLHFFARGNKQHFNVNVGAVSSQLVSLKI